MSTALSRRRAQARPDDNAPRFAAPPQTGHVESYFVRANHPAQRLAIWLKATVFAPAAAGEPQAEVWCTFFDGETGRVWAHKQSVPLSGARFGGAGGETSVAGCTFLFGRAGSAQGALQRHGSRCAWDLSWQAVPPPLGAALCLLPHRALIDGPFPKSKLLTPLPLLVARGRIAIDEREVPVEGWVGMQGHNWGREHAFEYAWGHCAFVDAAGAPFCVAEGFSSRIKIAGATTPRMSALVVRRGARSYRFDRLFDPWRQRAAIDDLSWTVRLHGRDGEAQLTMVARPAEVVCLGYRNPNGRLAFCLNSKLAAAQLRVNPINEEGFECTSEHGGALELLRQARDGRFETI